MLPIQPEVIDLISKKYHILEIVDLDLFDYAILKLYDVFAKYKNHVFSPNERIIILHHEIDYYASPKTTCGFTIYNLIVILHNLNVPHEFIIMLTNHYGIEKEIQKQFEMLNHDSTFKIIYTSQWYDFPKQVVIESPVSGKIKKLYCCLNGLQKQHRVAMLCALSEKELLDKGMISYHFTNE